MVCRIRNMGKHRMALDLRGGDVLYLEPNEISPPLQDELLADNVHMRLWLEQGLAQRIDSHDDELREYQTQMSQAAKSKTESASTPKGRAAGARAPAKSKAESPASPATEKGTGVDDDPSKKKSRGYHVRKGPENERT
jgi:hypothetical protein